MRKNFRNSPTAFVVRQSELEDRFDPRYYKPAYLSIISAIERKCELKTLREISTSINSGATPLAKGDAYVEKDRGIPFIRSGDLTEENIINYVDVLYIKREIHDKALKRSKLRKNDLLIAIVGATIGKVSIFTDEREANINQAIASARLKEETVNPLYVLHFLRSKFGQVQLDRLKRPVARANINLEEVGQIKIPIPSRPIQDHVAEIMEEAYKQRKEKLKEAEYLLAGINDYVLDKLGIGIPEVVEKKSFVVTLKDLKAGKRHDVFYYLPKYLNLTKVLEFSPYPLKTVSDVIFSIANGYDYRNYVEMGTPYLRVENVISGKIFLDKVLFIDKSINQINKDIKLDRGDVLFTRKGSFGRVAVVEEGHKDCVISSEIIRIKLMDEINPYYFSAFMNSKAGFTQSERKAVGAMNYSISQPELKTIKIPVPPIEIQNEIAKEVKKRKERAGKLKQEAEEIIKQAKEEVERMILGEEID